MLGLFVPQTVHTSFELYVWFSVTLVLHVVQRNVWVVELLVIPVVGCVWPLALIGWLLTSPQREHFCTWLPSVVHVAGLVLYSKPSTTAEETSPYLCSNLGIIAG